MSERSSSGAAVYVYGVVGAAERVEVPEAEMGPVRLVASGDLAALCSDVGSDVVGRRRELKAHANVLSAVSSRTAVVPFSFGTLFADDDELREQLLDRHAGHLRDELHRLRDVLQFNLRLVPNEDLLLADVLAGSPDLRRLRDQVGSRPAGASQAQQLRLGQAVGEAYRAAGERLGRAVFDNLTAHAVDARTEEIGGADGGSRAAFLVRRQGHGAFLDEADRLSESLQGRLTFRLVGPLPPFAFVEPLDDPPGQHARHVSSRGRSWAS